MKESLMRAKGESIIQQGCGLVDLTRPPRERDEERTADRARTSLGPKRRAHGREIVGA
jgi:hypothetical protein